MSIPSGGPGLPGTGGGVTGGGAADVWNTCVGDQGPIVVGSKARTCQKYCVLPLKSCGAVRPVWFACSPTVHAATFAEKLSLVEISMTYEIAPTGPDRGALPNVNCGRVVVTMTLLTGAVGTGA